MSLNPDMHKFLLHLERAQSDGREWVSVADVADIPSMQREIAVRTGWVKQKSFGNLAQYKITAAGYSALGDNADESIRQLRNGDVPAAAEPAQRAHIRSLIQPVGEPIIFQAEAVAPVEPEISVSVYSESLGTDARDASTPLHAERGGAAKPCKRPRCNEPCVEGSVFCQKHYEQKLAANARYRAKHNAARSAPATQPHVATVVIDEPPFSDEDTQPDLLPVNAPSADSFLPSMRSGEGSGEGMRSPLARLLIHSAVRSFTLARRVVRGIR